MSANVLIIDDDESIPIGCLQRLSEAGYRVQAVPSAVLALDRIERETFDVILMDLKMPGTSGMEVLQSIRRYDASIAVIVITAHGTTEAALQAGRLGAYDFLCKPLDPDQLIALIHRAASTRRHALEDSCVRLALDGQEASPDVLVGASEAFKRITRLIRKVALMDSNVLITGETGTGKELIARTIHLQSRRRQKPFVVVDCGSLVETLFESEMFGHVKGSFTGALDTTKGRFETANKGTLFLDEIANVDMNLQARLLRMVQDQEVSKVGSPRPRKVDVRIIAATNRELSREIAENRFRKDLFYRLNVVPLHIPPLRDRPEDVPLLTEYFLRKLSKEMPARIARISEEAMGLIKAYPWPGNVRELRNAIERAIIVSEADVLCPDDLMLGEAATWSEDSPVRARSLAEMEKIEIMKALRDCKGNRNQTAARLGIHRKTLREKLRKYRATLDESPCDEENPSALQ